MSTVVAALAWLACPRCADGDLRPDSAEPRLARCTTCAHAVLAAHAGEALALDTYLAQAIRRRTWLGDQIATGHDGSDLPATAPLTPPGGAGSARTTLFATGGILLGLAALVFLSLAWAALPLPGRIVLVLTVAAALLSAGAALTHRLRGAAETLTALGVTLTVLAGWTAPNVFDAAWSLRADALYATCLFTVLAFAATTRTVRSPLHTWPVTAAATAAVAASATVVRAATYDQPWLVTVVAAAAGTALLTAPDVLERWGPVRTVTALRLSDTGGVILRLTGMLLLGVAATATLVEIATGSLWTAACLTLALGAVPALFAYLNPSRRSAATAAAALAAGATVSTTLGLWQGAPEHTPVALAILAVATLLIAATQQRRVAPAAAAAVTATVLAVSIAATTATTVTATLTVIALGLYTAATIGRTSPAPWGHVAGAAAGFGTMGWWSWLSARDTLDGFPIEYWTGPVALLLLAAGSIHALRARTTTATAPRLALLPALLVAGMPGAAVGTLEAIVNTDPTRASLYLLAGAVLAAAGGRARLAAPIYAGTATSAVACLGHLGLLARAIPGWVILATAGLLVLTAAIRWEWLTLHTRRTRDWTASLH
jgi:hypothetical protein